MTHPVRDKSTSNVHARKSQAVIGANGVTARRAACLRTIGRGAHDAWAAAPTRRHLFVFEDDDVDMEVAGTMVSTVGDYTFSAVVPQG
jgi:hypothetical protein